MFEGASGVVLCAQAIQKWESGTISAKAIVEERARLRLGRARARVVYNDLLQGTRPDKAHGGPISRKKRYRKANRVLATLYQTSTLMWCKSTRGAAANRLVYHGLSVFIVAISWLISVYRGSSNRF